MTVSSFNSRYWNLAQAAAWVVYRERKLVEQLANPTQHSFGAISAYPTMWPDDRKQTANLADLQRKLTHGELTAKGYAKENPNTLGDIPASIWPDLQLRPPHAYDARELAFMHEPWTNIRVESASIKKLWRGSDETRDKTLFDWDEIRTIFERVKADNSGWSTNKVIDQTRSDYADRYGNRCPGVTTMKRHHKDWN